MVNSAETLRIAGSSHEAPAVARIAALCKALGDPLRLSVLRVMSSDSFGVLELCRIFHSSQPGMSHHLKVLRAADLVAQRREGNSIFYRRALPDAGDPLAPLIDELLRSVDTVELDGGVLAALRDVQAERAERSRAFFADNIDRFRQQQELVADFGLYGPPALAMVRDCVGDTGRTALEVGPGEGAFLVELARLFEHTCALDTSPAMLAAARDRVERAGLPNVELWQGDTSDSRLRTLKVDCVVLNMVLHHVPEPATLFRDIAPMLVPGGSLVVTELCRHNQAWTRERCGDVWLGFEPDELDGWAAAAGLVAGRGLYLAQRNGFRVQIRQFVRQNSH